MFKSRLTRYMLGAGTIMSALALNPSLVFADVNFNGASNIGIPENVTTLFKITDIGDFIGAIVSLLFLIAAILVFVYLVWGGVEWITSGGDKAKTQAARDRITAALVGLAVVAISYAIVVIAQAFFGVTIIGGINVPTPFGP